MPTAEATLLPPPIYTSSFEDEPRSARSLDAVGVETVLGAMIEQRRASQPSFASVVVPSGLAAAATPPSVLELSDDDFEDDRASGANGRAPTTSQIFLKAR